MGALTLSRNRAGRYGEEGPLGFLLCPPTFFYCDSYYFCIWKSFYDSCLPFSLARFPPTPTFILFFPLPLSLPFFFFFPIIFSRRTQAMQSHCWIGPSQGPSRNFSVLKFFLISDYSPGFIDNSRRNVSVFLPIWQGPRAFRRDSRNKECVSNEGLSP